MPTNAAVANVILGFLAIITFLIGVFTAATTVILIFSHWSVLFLFPITSVIACAIFWAIMNAE